MRIVINSVNARMGGSATHLPNFLQTVGRRRPADEFVAYVNPAWQAPLLPPNVRIERTKTNIRGSGALLWWNVWEVPRVAERERADVLVSLLNFGPLRSRIPHIVFERNPVYFCEYYLRELHWLRKGKIAATRRLAHSVMTGACRVITPSGAMRDMIRRWYPDLREDRFCVVPHGFGLETFRQPTPLPPAAAEAVRTSAGVKVLYVSHAASYKGVEILLDAVRRLRDRGVGCTAWLTVAREDWPEGFPRYEAFVARHRLEERVRLLGRVPHGAVHRLYEAADLFVHPSLCESFAFPLVEAMAVGLPVVAADRPLNHEMCGDAAAFYPPKDAEALASQIAALDADPERRRGMAAAGRTQAGHFSWDRHVDEVMEVVDAVA